jgi:hypothetical protein
VGAEDSGRCWVSELGNRIVPMEAWAGCEAPEFLAGFWCDCAPRLMRVIDQDSRAQCSPDGIF